MKVLKKSLSLLIVIVMISSLLTVAVSAQDAYQFNARENVVSFRDSAGTGEAPENWAHGGCIIRSGEWITYDISGLKEGTYSLKAQIANYDDTKIRVITNFGTAKELETKTMAVAKTSNPETGAADGSMQFFCERDLGSVYLSGDSDTLTIRHSSGYAFVIKSLTLTYVSQTSSYSVHYRTPIDYVHKNGEVDYPVNEYITGNGKDILPDVMTIRGGVANYYVLPVDFLEDSSTYKLSADLASNGNIKADIYAGKTPDNINTLKKSNVVFPSSGGWNLLAQDVDLTEIYFTENDKYIKIVPANAGGASQIALFKFTKLNKDVLEVDAKDDCVSYSHAGANALFYTVTTTTPTLSAAGVATLRYADTNYYTYDVSELEKGTYKVYANYMAQMNFTFTLSTGSEKENVPNVCGTDLVLPANGTWYDDFYLKSEELTKVYIKDDTNFIKITPQSGTTQLVSLVFEKVSKDNLIDTVIPYNNTISDVAGEGFYAKNGNTVYDTFEPAIATLSKNMTAVRSGNWYKYDLSNVEKGKYNIIIDGASYLGNTTVDIFLNDELILDEAPLYSSGVYNEIGNNKKVVIGVIDIPEITEENPENILMLKGSVSAFNLKSITLTKNPFINVLYERGETLNKTLTEDVYEGKMYFDAFSDIALSGNDLLVTFAIYKTNNETGAKQLYKAYVCDDAQAHGEISDIVFEEGYTYSQKVFIWNMPSISE